MKSWPWPTKKNGTKFVNRELVSAWLPDRECIWYLLIYKWKKHGVWGLVDGKPSLLKPDYFSKSANGKKIEFYSDCYVPFLRDFAQAIEKEDDSKIFFFEPIPNEEPPILLPGDICFDKTVYAPHWYDLSALFSKSFDGYITHDVQGLSKVVHELIRGKKEYYHRQLFWAHGRQKELYFSDL